MSMSVQHRLPDSYGQSDRVVHRLAGETFTMDYDEVPVRLNVREFGEFVLCFVDVRFDVHVHRGGDYTIRNIVVKCSKPPIRGKWSTDRIEVPVEKLSIGQHNNCSLYDAINSSVIQGCSGAIEDRIEEMLADL